ncbi:MULTISPECIES: hypothetical protein [unclassified Corynebacterium]|uniref:hypothetical protein n=1 Tax=unclassified Corynebacterium TaxID=2624378 RepID=UPI0029CA6E4A|nr:MULTISPECIES: hypothetical protein [unclassified Corynebacterium]WPF66985.1 hypothetical protein OLX12_04485 [Corynebacterium sp. 22KM0430]WPF69473.1 hypothetical protein OLW90_04480 [Corynebacterium sp. 21KM1197]
MKKIGTITPLAHPDLSAMLSRYLRDHHGDLLGRLAAILRHPRCLARTHSGRALWRPPVHRLPDPLTGGELNVALSRHRMGPRARARIRGFNPHHEAAYLISLRFSRADGQPVRPAVAEAWVRALLPEGAITAVHEFLGEATPTYRWCVDGRFLPLDTPPSLFTEASSASAA